MSNLLDYVSENRGKKIVIVGSSATVMLSQFYLRVKRRNPGLIKLYQHEIWVLYLFNDNRVYAIQPDCLGLSYEGKHFNVDVLLFTPGTRKQTTEKFISNFKNKYRTIGRLKND